MLYIYPRRPTAGPDRRARAAYIHICYHLIIVSMDCMVHTIREGWRWTNHTGALLICISVKVQSKTWTLNNIGLP